VTTYHDRVVAIGRLLEDAARAHHVAFDDEPHPDWPWWYARHVREPMAAHVGFAPGVEEIRDWLIIADRRHQTEAPDRQWPEFFATVILELVEGDTAGV